MTNDLCTICPEDCSTANVQLPPIEIDQQCAWLQRKLTEICDLYIRPSGVTTSPAGFDTASMFTYLSDNVDNSDTTGTKILHLRVIGDLPAPDKTEIALPKGASITNERTYTLNLDWSVGPDSHHEFAKALQCGDTSFTFYYAARGGTMHGQLIGLVPTKVDADMPHERGEDGFAKAIITLQFKACGDPFRIDDPYAS